MLRRQRVRKTGELWIGPKARSFLHPKADAAITYRLAKEEIFALRKDAANILLSASSRRPIFFDHEVWGTISAGYFRDVLLGEIKGKQSARHKA